MTNWSEELTHDGSAERPIPEPRTFDQFVNVYTSNTSTWGTRELAVRYRVHDACLHAYHDTYNAETGERINSECIWEKGVAALQGEQQ